MADEIEMIPGTPQFNRIVLKLNDRITPQTLTMLSYNHRQLKLIQDGIYIMPAYINLSAGFNLFFIVAQLIQDDWIMAFAKANIKNEYEITNLSNPIPTGKGLNELDRYDSDKANQILKYFNTLVETKHGNWRLIQ
ncbi:hypothetical protein WR164_09310 [Philodulcilactobacillus myokoensis]|uniref:Uncharacterized protein n=1 Tax=Philodulcilactobacillus myokoensis TaxID=2929573 RepID=A0A9W6B104_9LACO|nr:hypothetical protein [Philodulcilactobacillus myokoensis]GLB46952.1 hypothetical protein WR164_09310 [Philodulcilactobacillus myokoensis]